MLLAATVLTLPTPEASAQAAATCSGTSVYFTPTGASTASTAQTYSTASLSGWTLDASQSYVLANGSPAASQPTTAQLWPDALHFLEAISIAFGTPGTDLTIDDDGNFPDFAGNDAVFLATNAVGTSSGALADDDGIFYTGNVAGPDHINPGEINFVFESSFEVDDITRYGDIFLEHREYVDAGSFEIYINGTLVVDVVSSTTNTTWETDPTPTRIDPIVNGTSVLVTGTNTLRFEMFEDGNVGVAGIATFGRFGGCEELCVPDPYATVADKPAGSTQSDCDADGADDATDPDNGNPCVPSPFATAGEQPASGTDADCDGDGALNAADTDPGDPCAAPGDTGWVEQGTNDCDNDGITVAAGDSLDTNPCVPSPYATAAEQPATGVDNDCDNDGVPNVIDPAPGNPCVDNPYATEAEQPANGTDADCDGDGALNAADTDPADPCVDPTDAGWVAAPTNDCDGDGVTVGGGDTDDTNPCVPDNTGPTCDADGDGVLNAVDADPADPCVSPTAATWVALPTNDCDGDGVTAATDLDDFDVCADAVDAVIASCSDTDGDGVTDDVDPDLNDPCIPDNTGPDCDVDGDGVANGVDADPADPCVSPSAVGWMVQATNDCDGDGVTAATDADDFDVCQDAAGFIPSCTDTDGDGVTDDVDTDPADPCSSVNDAGWTAQNSNDCDGDGTTVGQGDSDDFDSCVDTGTPAPGTNDCDMDGVTVADGDLDDTDGCMDAAGQIPSCSDTDGDGITDDVDPDPADTCNPINTTPNCDADGDGVLNAVDADPADPCVSPTAATWVALPTNDCDGDGVTAATDLDDQNLCIDAAGTIPSCTDTDGDGVTDDVDTDPADPCSSVDDAGWMAQNSNDCDGDGTTVGQGDSDDFDSCVDTGTPAPGTNDCDMDGVTVADGDLDDFDGCMDAAGQIPSCSDTDGDGITDDVDPDPADTCNPINTTPNCDADGDGVLNAVDADPADPCVSPTAATWVALPTNDCDGDGVTAATDLDDFDVCADAVDAVIASCSDTDGDGVTDDIDADPADPCADRNQVGWTTQNSNDCDNDGVTLGEGDLDDRDACMDATGMLPSCVDSDGDGVTDDIDADPADPCVDPTQAGWAAQGSNDCDGDGTPLNADADDTDPCIPDNTGPTCDFDGDGIVNSVDPDATDPCISPASVGWMVQATNDCDGDGVTAATDVDDFDICVDSAGTIPSCTDTDGDGVTDDVDTDPADPCSSVNDAGWMAQNSNDCDGDGTTVGQGDSDDFDSCVDTGTPAPGTNDCDMDGVTVADGDLDDFDGCMDAAGQIPSCSDTDGDGITDDLDPDLNDPCVPVNTGPDCDADGDGVANAVDIDPADPCQTPTAVGWVALATNDCDGDGVTVADGDLDDTDECQDAAGTIASCLDTDGDGITDDVDTDPADPCVPDNSGPLCDIDGDGVPNGADMDPADPCVSPTAATFVALATNDCDGDGVTVADGDLDDYDGCMDAAGALLSCTDTDGDGITDDVDPDPANECDPINTTPNCDADGDGVLNAVDADPADPCVSPSAATWVALPTNDCDGDGVTVADGDLDDFDECQDDAGVTPACSDTDGDGVTDDIDADPADPCADRNQVGWTTQNSNDCDGDGVTLGDGDEDDRDVCVDASGTLPSCVDTDGDGVTDDLDDEPEDPCFTPTQAGWTPRMSNDCDGDGVTVADGDIDDFDECADASVADICTDTDGDGVVDYLDTDPADPCAERTDAGWAEQLTNDCDGDGYTVLDGDTDDFDVCQDDAGVAPSCRDTDGDGIPDDIDQDPNNSCLDPTEAGWVAALANDCDEDGVTVGDGDVDDRDACVDAAGEACFMIDGRVWYDIDRGTDQDADEVDFSGVRLVLIDTTTGQAIGEAFTASPYQFFDVPRGTYEIRVDQSTLPVGVGQTYEEDGSLTEAITVSVINSDQLSKDFGYATAQICGVVQQGAKPLGQREVTVVDSAGNEFITMSDEDGNYCVEGTLESPLMSGTAKVSFMHGQKVISESIQATAGKRSERDLEVAAPVTVPGTALTGPQGLDPTFFAGNRSNPNNAAAQPVGGTSSDKPGGPLALTGSSSRELAAVAMTMIIAGGALVALGKRRRRDEEAGL